MILNRGTRQIWCQAICWASALGFIGCDSSHPAGGEAEAAAPRVDAHSHATAGNADSRPSDAGLMNSVTCVVAEGGITTVDDGGAEPPSCEGLSPSCGPRHDEDCCSSPVVPGGSFYRDYDGVTYTDRTNPATVSTFRLDRFEVTVARFRRFVLAYSNGGTADGAGKDPNDPKDPGWSSDWNTKLPSDKAAFLSELNQGYGACATAATHRTWNEQPGTADDSPINCVSWYEASAFCIWDNGRLPSEAEWNYAAAGGCEQRVYPWSLPSQNTNIDNTYACTDSCGWPRLVGATSPKGDGKWRQADLTGDVVEWTLDWYAKKYTNPCIDCTNLQPDVFLDDPRFSTTDTRRVVRTGLPAKSRVDTNPLERDENLGFRCARHR